jgi:hypothetical protein
MAPLSTFPEDRVLDPAKVYVQSKDEGSVGLMIADMGVVRS